MKWEYKTITFLISNRGDSSIFQEIFDKELNKFGEDGWELRNYY